MLDAIIIARFAIVEKGGGGRGEGDGKMGSPFLFEGNFCFRKKQLILFINYCAIVFTIHWNLYSNLLEVVGRWVDICIYL